MEELKAIEARKQEIQELKEVCKPVINISAYASQSYRVEDYDEVFTELRVLDLLKEK